MKYTEMGCDKQIPMIKSQATYLLGVETIHPQAHCFVSAPSVPLNRLGLPRHDIVAN